MIDFIASHPKQTIPPSILVPAQCNERDIVISTLQSLHAKPLGLGPVGENLAIVFVNPQTGDWYIVFTDSQTDTACIVAAGKNWHPFPLSKEDT